MSLPHIVVVEDEPAIRRGVVDALRVIGYPVFEAADGDSGLEAAPPPRRRVGAARPIAAAARTASTCLAELRKARQNLPVIILTARGSEEDRVRGLKMGRTIMSSSRFRPANCSRASRQCCGGPPRDRYPSPAPGSGGRGSTSSGAKSTGRAGPAANCPKLKRRSWHTFWPTVTGP